LDPARSQQIRELYRAALERPAAERASFVADRAVADVGLRESVELLLSQHEITEARRAEPRLSAPTFAAGVQIAGYRIEALLGEGGVGSVYRATDAKLQRPVAIKFLTAAAVDENARGRFQQEAQTASSLNHPHIVTVHDVGEHDGREYIVSELIDGGTLADWLKGSRGWKQRVELLIGVADAIAAAHAAGVLHRDIKPANILIGRNGYAKLADFGLAKLLAEQDGRAKPQHTTGIGVVIGTVAYMSPEQTAGQPLDERSDIFSFGVVLYEALAGRRPFESANDLELMKTIMHGAPPPLPSDLPEALRMAVDKALEKDPAERYQSMRELVVDLKRVVQRRTTSVAPSPEAASRRPTLAWPTVTLGVAFLAALAAAIALAALHFQPAPAAQPIRFRIPAPGLRVDLTKPIGVSPDGRRIAYLVAADNATKIAVRALDAFDAQTLANTDDAAGIAWAPDNRTIAFFASGTLRKISSDGGSSQLLAPSTFNGGASWGEQGVIVLTSFEAAGGVGVASIGRIGTDGGAPIAITKVDTAKGDQIHLFPSFLPGGRRFLFAAGGLSTNGVRANAGTLYVGSVDGAAPKAVTSLDFGNSSPSFVYASGYLLFVRDAALLAQRFDADAGTLAGEAVPVASPVSAFAVSANGVLAYSEPPSGAQTPVDGAITELRWFGRDGTPLGVLARPAVYSNPKLSPDGGRVAVDIVEAGNRDIWTIDVARGVPARLTFEPGDDLVPVWSPDGRDIVFASGRDSGGVLASSLYRRAANGTGSDELVYSAGVGQAIAPQDWTNEAVLFAQSSIAQMVTNADLWRLPNGGERSPERFLETPTREGAARVSPDGRWIAYTSNASGAYQIVVQTYPNPARGKWQVSTGGAIEAKWRADGKELFFLASDGNLMAVDVEPGETFTFGEPHVLFQTGVPIPSVPFFFSFDVTPDGQRFLVNVPQPTAPAREDARAPTFVNVVLNWTSALARSR
jgi:eukaryotic-like serine/threonine-protein kinase